MIRSFALGLLALCAFSGTACTSLTYVTQAAAGQDDLNRRARDIDMLVAEKRVDARTRRLLSQVSVIKRFGEEHGLAATSNYTKYVRVDRPVAVWVVSASDPLHFRSQSWTFPLVGSFTYLGWFKLDEANAFAADLKRDGLDVDVRGAGAYSTAGYFEDAVLSTMLAPGKRALGELADTVLHEMAHATFFVRHQSTLNESVANFVGDTLAQDYLDGALGPDAEETIAYRSSEDTARVRGRAMQAAYLSLGALYASSEPDDQKLARKAELLTRLRTEVHFKRPINNATLIQYRTYHSGQGELAALLGVCDRDWPRFMLTLKQLERRRFETAQEHDVGKIVRPLADGGCLGSSPPQLAGGNP